MSYPSAAIDKINIDGNAIFKIAVIAKNTDVINIESLTDGEYKNDYKVITTQTNNQLNIGLKRVSINQTPDDKLNAHKVVAAELSLTMPTSKNLSVVSDIGSLLLKGDFDRVAVKLNDGSFNFNGTAKNAQVETRDGPIAVTTLDAGIDTNTHHGVVVISEDMLGKNVFKLKTYSGNITVTKKE